MGKIIFVLVGGLVNCMCVVVLVVMLVGKMKSELSIIWFWDWVLNVLFY